MKYDIWNMVNIRNIRNGRLNTADKIGRIYSIGNYKHIRSIIQTSETLECKKSWKSRIWNIVIVGEIRNVEQKLWLSINNEIGRINNIGYHKR